MKNGNRRKEYVEVVALFTPEGYLIPQTVVLGNGRRFTIDKVLDIRRAATQRPGMPPLQPERHFYSRYRFQHFNICRAAETPSASAGR